MKIIDKADEDSYLKFGLIGGNVYKDCHGNFVLATDKRYVVNLANGSLIKTKGENNYKVDAEFELLKTTLEIQ